MAGKSSRFPNMKPKWMLTHPMSNKFMVIESLLGLNLTFFDKIYFVCLSEHQSKYDFVTGFLSELDEIGILHKSKIIFLDNQTSSQSETVYNVIMKENIEGFIFIKDSDAYYETKLEDDHNQVAFFDLNDMDNINARTKSYIEFDINGLITNIIEKRVISSTFSAGGYGFRCAKEFCRTYEKFMDTDEECYISHIIFEMILSGGSFYGLRTKNFKDWGTLESWNHYKSQYKCLFVDIDGTLVVNSSVHFPPYVGSSESIQDNIDFLNDLYRSGKVKIILTTSRPNNLRNLTLEELNAKGILYDELITGLPHCQRIVINDFAKSNPYPSCKAINIPRNSNQLKDFFE